MTQKFEDFMTQRLAASDAFGDGNVGPFLELLTDNDPVTYFSPRSEVVSGPAEVTEANETAAQRFVEGGRNHVEILHMGQSGLLAYWVGIQRSEVRIKGSDDSAPLVPMAFRVTELFRDEDDEWKLFHRHTDRLPNDAS